MSKIYTFDSLSDLENYINQSSPSNDIAIYAEDGVYHVRLFDNLNTNEITVPNAESAYSYYNRNYAIAYNQAQSTGKPLPVYDENQIFNMKSIAYKLNNNLYKRINKAGKIDKADITTAYLHNIISNHNSQDLKINGLVNNLINKQATNRTVITSNTYWQW